ncbi:MAG: hypothetical protein QOG68_1033, partial [Solirubrobacteraceae bacterium]|nr:hypothetical protein [Solirubrobacteraceae bacterium]
MIRHALDFRRAVCACALLAVFATAAPADAKVRIVHRGPAVRLVQQKVHTAVDGVYGPASARAVRAWQKAHGLHADGIVGPATWASFGITANKPILRRLVKRKRAGTKAHRASRSSPTRHGGRPRVVSRGREVMIAQRR